MTAGLARARSAATALLLEQRLYSLRIDVTKLSYDRRIIFDSMQHFCLLTRTSMHDLSDGTDCLRDGCTLLVERGGVRHCIVLYNEDVAPPSRRGFTLAHEIGHIYLGHRADGDRQERQANRFAAELLAPEILVRALAERTDRRLLPEEVQRVFALSRQAAENRVAALSRPARFTPLDTALLRKLAHLLPDDNTGPLVDI